MMTPALLFGNDLSAILPALSLALESSFTRYNSNASSGDNPLVKGNVPSLSFAPIYSVILTTSALIFHPNLLWVSCRSQLSPTSPWSSPTAPWPRSPLFSPPPPKSNTKTSQWGLLHALHLSRLEEKNNGFTYQQPRNSTYLGVRSRKWSSSAMKKAATTPAS